MKLKRSYEGRIKVIPLQKGKYMSNIVIVLIDVV